MALDIKIIKKKQQQNNHCMDKFYSESNASKPPCQENQN